MKYLKLGRISLTAIVVELLTILILVAAVALFGPSDPEAAAAYAERLGVWIGPIGGFVFCFAGGWYVSRKLISHQLLNGFALGVAVAIIDVLLLIAGGSAFRLIFAVSNVGRIVAGALGGWFAAKQSSETA